MESFFYTISWLLSSVFYFLWTWGWTIVRSLWIIIVTIVGGFIAIGAAQHYFNTFSYIDEKNKTEIINRLRYYYFTWKRLPSVEQNITAAADDDNETSTSSHQLPPSKKSLPWCCNFRLCRNIQYIYQHYRIPLILPILFGIALIVYVSSVYIFPFLSRQSVTLFIGIFRSLAPFFQQIFSSSSLFTLSSFSSITTSPVSSLSEETIVESVPVSSEATFYSTDTPSSGNVSSSFLVQLLNSSSSSIFDGIRYLMEYIFVHSSSSLDAGRMYLNRFIPLLLTKLLSFRIEVILLVLFSLIYIGGLYYNYHQQRRMKQRKSNPSSSSTRVSPSQQLQLKTDIQQPLPFSTPNSMDNPWNRAIISDTINTTTTVDSLVDRYNLSTLKAVENEAYPRRLMSTTFPITNNGDTKNINNSRKTMENNTDPTIIHRSATLPPPPPLPSTGDNYKQYIDIDSEPSATTPSTTTASYSSPVTAYIPTPPKSLTVPEVSTSLSTTTQGLNTSPSTATTKPSHFRNSSSSTTTTLDRTPESILSNGKKSRISLGGFSTLSNISERTKGTGASVTTVGNHGISPQRTIISSSLNSLSLPMLTGDPVVDTRRMKNMVKISTDRKLKRQSLAIETLKKLGITVDNDDISQLLQSSTMINPPQEEESSNNRLSKSVPRLRTSTSTTGYGT